jgi:hypothetical protein
MIAFNRYSAILGFALASAQAQAVEFSFTLGAGTITDPLTGLTITSSAWSSTAAGQFETAALSFATDGMGVYNPTENTNTANANANPIAGSNGNTADALGNKGGVNDLILFSFSSKVSLQTLTMLQFGGDSDLSLWAGTGSPFSPSGMTVGALGTATLFENASAANEIKSASLVTFTGTYDWLAVAARIGHTDDLAKLKSLTVTPVAQPVPDAATWMTMLAGLGLVGFAVNRRRRI